MIEMALVFPIFAFMIFAIFELALIFFFSFVLESAMYNVTRLVKIQTTPAAVEQDVRDLIGQLSYGLMDPNKVIITTDLNVNFADDWSNQPAEICGPANPGDTCETLPGCNGVWNDDNNNSICDIGPPPLQLQVPGAIVSYIAFYKKEIVTPGLGLLVGGAGGGGHYLSDGTTGGYEYHVISSGTVSRNEPS